MSATPFDKNQRLLSQETIAFASAGRIKYFNIVMDHGHGAIICDANGRQYIDLLASASSTNTGISHPQIVRAIQEQAKRLIQYTPAYFANTPAAKLAARLAKLAPISGPVKFAWGNSGAEANDALMKFARAYTGRPYIVTFTGACHGASYGALSESTISLNLVRRVGPLVPGIVHIPFPSPWYRLKGESQHNFVERMWQNFQIPFETYLPPDETAAILIEPIQGDGGIVKVPDQFMRRLYHFAKAHGILFCTDEINQGMGRSGKWWSIQHFTGMEPDLMTVGKSLASGLPLSAVVGRAQILDSLASPADVFTTAGNPVTAAAANATLDVFRQEHLVNRSARLGKLAKDFFDREAEKYDFIGGVRMYGLDGGIDIIDPQTGQGDAKATDRLIHRIFELGAIMISLRGSTLRFQPPLVISKEELKQAFDIIDQAFGELAR